MHGDQKTVRSKVQAACQAVPCAHSAFAGGCTEPANSRLARKALSSWSQATRRWGIDGPSLVNRRRPEAELKQRVKQNNVLTMLLDEQC